MVMVFLFILSNYLFIGFRELFIANIIKVL